MYAAGITAPTAPVPRTLPKDIKDKDYPQGTPARQDQINKQAPVAAPGTPVQTPAMQRVDVPTNGTVAPDKDYETEEDLRKDAGSNSYLYFTPPRTEETWRTEQLFSVTASNNAPAELRPLEEATVTMRITNSSTRGRYFRVQQAVTGDAAVLFGRARVEIPRGTSRNFNVSEMNTSFFELRIPAKTTATITYRVRAPRLYPNEKPSTQQATLELRVRGWRVKTENRTTLELESQYASTAVRLLRQ